jgi:hypothetical protein
VLKAKLLLGLALAMSVLAVVAAPASAQWQSKTGQQKGRAVSTTPGTLEGGGGTVTCESAEGIWKLPQAKQTKGGGYSTLKLAITRWNNCKAANFEAKVSQCEFELKQPQRQEQKVLSSQLSPKCTVEVPIASCTISFGSQSNQNLGSVTLSNVGQNQLDVFNITGITQTVNSGCEGVGIKGSNTGTLKAEVTLEGVNVV